MKSCIHRGAKQIGGSCVEIEHDGARLVIDCGMPLDTEVDDPKLLPPVNTAGLLAVLISHGHADHYGLAHHLPDTIPVAMGAAARRIIQVAAPFSYKAPPAFAGPDFENGKPLQFGPFTVTPYLVDHSAYDAYAVLVEAGGRRLFYSGDLRSHGRKAACMERMVANPPSNIDALIMEGTALSRMDDTTDPLAEEGVEARFAAIMRETKGLVMVHTSAQNIDRVVSLFKAAKHTGRTLLIDLYTAVILEATGNASLPQSDWRGISLCIPQRQRVQIKNNQWFAQLETHNRNRVYLDAAVAHDPSKYVLLFRPLWMRDLSDAGVLAGATLIYSQWEGYLKDGKFAAMEEWLAAHSIPLEVAHTSGHASVKFLSRFVEAMKPKALVPIHSFSPERYASFYPDTVLRADGEWWDV
jgi:ribonuclease J